MASALDGLDSLILISHIKRGECQDYTEKGKFEQIAQPCPSSVVNALANMMDHKHLSLTHMHACSLSLWGEANQAYDWQRTKNKKIYRVQIMVWQCCTTFHFWPAGLILSYHVKWFCHIKSGLWRWSNFTSYTWNKMLEHQVQCNLLITLVRCWLLHGC